MIKTLIVLTALVLAATQVCAQSTRCYTTCSDFLGRTTCTTNC